MPYSMSYIYQRKILPYLLNGISQVISDGMRSVFFRILGLKVGDGSVIRKRTVFDRPDVAIGNNVLINYGCEFHIGWGGDSIIEIEDNTKVGMDCCFICVTHEIAVLIVGLRETATPTLSWVAVFGLGLVQ